MTTKKETEQETYQRITRRAWIVSEFKPLLKNSDNEQLNELYLLVMEEAKKRGLKEDK